MLILNKDGKLRNMEKTSVKFKVAALTGIILLIATIGVSASLMTQYIIHSSGTIAPGTGSLTSSSTFAYSSQLRYTYLGSDSMLLPDWPLVAATVKSYNMGPVIQKALYTYLLPHELVQWRSGRDTLQEAIDALHAQGIKYHISHAIMFSDFVDIMDGVGVPQIAPPRPDMRQIRADGSKVNTWADPTNPDFRAFVKEMVEELVRDYEIDGYSFDYVRYDYPDVPYGPYAKAEFEQYLGETISDADFSAGGVFAPGGSRYSEFMQWRPIPISKLVRDIRSWMDAARQQYHPNLPPLEYSATTFAGPYIEYNNYYWIGQDPIQWVIDGSVDILMPMLYDPPGGRNVQYAQEYINLLGGTEGVIPFAPLHTHVAHGTPKTPQQLADEVAQVQALGADGWSTWAYDGGPGTDLPNYPDIIPYWDLIPMPPTFSLINMSVSRTDNSATVTWTTELPSTSKIEYSTAPLFVPIRKSSQFVDSLLYWDIDHIPGTIVENSTPVTSHSVTLTSLNPGVVYYFRVQSQDPSGIATSKVYTFQL